MGIGSNRATDFRANSRVITEERISVDLYESMVFWFAKEFLKAILGLGLILGIILFFQWLNSDD